MLLLWRRLGKPARPASSRWEGPLPVVTVQLPVYNEANVVARLIDAACSLDYPPDRLEIQLLDDSDDETSRIAAARVAHWRRLGRRIEHVRRGGRQGYKAGALAEGVRRARGDGNRTPIAANSAEAASAQPRLAAGLAGLGCRMRPTVPL